MVVSTIRTDSNINLYLRAILIFEIDFGHIGQAEVVSNGKTPLQLDSILKSTEAYLAGSNRIVGVTTDPDSEHAYKVMLAKPAMAALWVNQYTGEVIGKYQRAEIFKYFSFRLYPNSRHTSSVQPEC